MAKTSKPKSSKSNRRTSDVGCPVPFRRGGVIMPHVVSPEATGGEATTPPIVPEASRVDLERTLAREERDALCELRFQKRIEEFYDKALPLVKNRRIETRQLQHALGIGYRHACQIIRLLEERGVIGRSS